MEQSGILRVAAGKGLQLSNICESLTKTNLSSPNGISRISVLSFADQILNRLDEASYIHIYQGNFNSAKF